MSTPSDSSTPSTPSTPSDGSAPSDPRGVRDPQIAVPGWTFLTNHAHVVVAISRDPELRQRDIAHLVGITPGAVVKILSDLERAGVVTAERVGRRNRYRVDGSVRLRHPLESSHTVDELIEPLRPE